MSLDNAALIFPAIRRPRWVNTFRLSVTLTEPVDRDLLQQAVEDLWPRFPSLYVRLGTGLFWHYLEEIDRAPRVMEDYAYPLTHMSRRELQTCGLRVLVFRERIAVEFFHALTDGTGGLRYLKTLTARYLELRYGQPIPPEQGVLDRTEAPAEWETADAFHRVTGEFPPLGGSEENVFRLTGTPDVTGFMHLTTGVVSSRDLAETAHKYGGTVTALLAAVMAQSIAEMQADRAPRRRWRPVKITVPINLRKVFGVDTMRNFTLVINVGVDPRLKDYTISELCREYKNRMALEVTPEKMAARVAENVIPQKLLLMRLVPLPLKTLVMRAVYHARGERKGCVNVSNLGVVETPEAMASHVRRFEFIIGVQMSYPNNCSVATFGDVTCINMIRSIRETELERRFFSRLVELGVPVLIESNEGRQ